MHLPKYLQIEPSRTCNQSCKQCVHKDEKGLMSMGTFFRILETNPDCTYIKFQGLGEPMINPDLYDMCRWSHSKGIFNEILTNGTLPPGDGLLAVVDLFVVSVDTLIEENYLSNRGKGYDRLMKTLDILAIEYDGHVSINCTKSAWNTPEEVNEVEEMCENNGWGFSSPLQEVWTHDDSDSKYSQFYASVKHKQYHSLRESFCKWGYEKAYYDYLGRLHPCCIRMEDRYELGTEWNGKKMEEFRNGREENPWCKLCPM